VEDKIFFDGSPETQHARNTILHPYVALHLESGDDVVIVEGVVEALSKPGPTLGEKLAEVYRVKYADIGYSPEPTMWDEGGLYSIIPLKALAWTNFTIDPSKFVFNNG
jgi:hypothetical protein